jgi:hypothetical protein
MAFGTINADTLVTSTSGGILGAGNASIMKNRIINGAMVIDQRNAGASVTPANNTYTLDRWNTYQSTSSAYSVQQNAGSVTPPVGFTNYLGVTSLAATSLSAGSYFMLTQIIEGFNTADLQWGTANAKTITLNFWVRSSLTGTFGGSLENGGNNRSYPFTYTISSANTWTQASVTIAGDTTGTWATDNTAGIKLRIGLGVGTTASTTAGAWAAGDYYSATGAVSVVGTSGATFYITGVQLEVGSSATGFEYVNYQTSLANCQRYFQQYGDNATNKNVMPYGSAAGTTEIDAYMTLPVVMRTTPTLTSLNLTAYDGAATPLTLTAGTVYNATASTFGAYWTVSGATTFRPYMIRTYTSAGYMQLSAEL